MPGKKQKKQIWRPKAQQVSVGKKDPNAPRKEQVPVVARAVNVQKLLGERGQDVTAPAKSTEALREQQVVQSMTKTLPINCTVNMKTISNLSLGIVLHALKHGLAAATDGPATNPYYMYRYLTDSFVAAMKGEAPLITQAPVWYWEIYYAIKKKQSPFKLSEVQYTWVFKPSSVADESPIPMGIGPEAYSIVLTAGLQADEVLGFPAFAPNAPYTLDLGASAISSLWAFCQGSNDMTKLISDPERGAYTFRDTSAFSVVYPELGGSFNTPNALKSTIYSERNIDSPLFAKFANYQPEGTEDWRGWHKAGVTGGSSALIGPCIAKMESKEEMRAKVSPIIKLYNFDEFFEVLSLSLSTAMGNGVQRSGSLPPPCPLSPIQAQILLRQTIIPLFSNELCPDLRLSQSNSELMLPFTVGQNGVSMGTRMLLPTFLAENIRASKSFQNRINADNPRTTLRMLSVLARPAQKPQLGNYSVPGGTTVYTTDGNDQLVNLIDCSSIQGNNVLYLDLTRSQIATLAATWNEWIQGLSTNLSPLIEIGQTDGVSLLKTITYTNFQGQLQQLATPAPNAPQTITRHKSASNVVKIKGLERKMMGSGAPVPGTGYFDTVTDRYTTSLQIVSAPVWKYLSLWILPVAIANPASLEEQSMQGWSAFFIEAYRIPRTTAGGQGVAIFGSPGANISAYDRHVMMSAIDVKGIATDGQTELISELLEMGKKGRGSFLEALASLVGPAINAIGMI